MKWFLLFLAAASMAMNAHAADAENASTPRDMSALPDEDAGTLNPDEISLQRSLQQARGGNVDMVICAQGYLMTKMGAHADARTIFETCAKKGWTGTMTWMSYMADNGFGGPEDPDAAAEWDRKAAELGDPVGQFNYGLDLLRGRGVAPDEVRGRSYVDRAAAAGLKDARDLVGAGYDTDVVTPDADNWKYQRIY